MPSTTTRSRAGRVLGRISEIWIEMDEAQRRMLEIRTGLRSPSRPRSWNTGTLDGVRGTAARRGATDSRGACD